MTVTGINVLAVDGFPKVHGGFGFVERNDEGGRLLDFAVAHDLVIGNTLFEKRDSYLIIYASGNNQTQIDYILTHRRLRKSICDVKVIPGEECLSQQRLLVCILQVTAPARVKRNFTPRLLTWKLLLFLNSNLLISVHVGLLLTLPRSLLIRYWIHLKSGLNSAAEEVCGHAKNHQRRKETWWWNSRVYVAVKEKRQCYTVFTKLKRQKL